MAIPEFAMNPMSMAMWSVMLMMEVSSSSVVIPDRTLSNISLENEKVPPGLSHSISASSAESFRLFRPKSTQFQNEDSLEDAEKVNRRFAWMFDNTEVTFPTFCQFLSTFHSRASDAEKVSLAFSVYSALETSCETTTKYARLYKSIRNEDSLALIEDPQGFGIGAIRLHLKGLLGSHLRKLFVLSLLAFDHIEAIADRTLSAVDADHDRWINRADFFGVSQSLNFYRPSICKTAIQMKVPFGTSIAKQLCK